MRRAALLAVALLASAAAAQPVALRLWNVPPGARICETASYVTTTRAMSPDTVRTTGGTTTAVTCWGDFETRDGRLVAARELLTRQDDAGFEDPYADPILGDTLLLARAPDASWAARLLHGRPTEEQQDVLRTPFLFALDDLYLPETPVSVGDTWEIPAAVLAHTTGEIADSAAAPYRYTVRLDSLGERAGRRVAYLTHDGAFTLSGGGAPVRIRKTRVSAIDLETGVETWADQTYDYSVQYEMAGGRGKQEAYRLKMHRRSGIERSIEAPQRR